VKAAVGKSGLIFPTLSWVAWFSIAAVAIAQTAEYPDTFRVEGEWEDSGTYKHDEFSVTAHIKAHLTLSVIKGKVAGNLVQDARLGYQPENIAGEGHDVGDQSWEGKFDPATGLFSGTFKVIGFPEGLSGVDTGRWEGSASPRQADEFTGTFTFDNAGPIRAKWKWKARIIPEASECTLSYEWCPGPAIKVLNYGYYPTDPNTLRDMRPGDLIGLSVRAEDYDALLQNCGSSEENETKKHQLTLDKLDYDWKLEAGVPGKGSILHPGGSESNR
jgi:hypothetical protein